jgi:DNA-binding LytR/AlgR family response regulator
VRRPTAVIAEDEPALRRELRESLATLWHDLEVVAEVDDGIKGVDALETHRPDVVFLDVQMPTPATSRSTSSSSRPVATPFG